MKTEDSIKLVAGLVGIVLLYKLLKKSKKHKEQRDNDSNHSAFVGSPFGKRVLFTLTNSTSKQQEVPLFNAYSNTQNQEVGITPSMSEFNRTLLNDPKRVRSIEIKASGSTSQAQKPIKVYCKDATGEFKGKYLHPMVSAYQVAQDMATIEPKNLVLDGQCYMNYMMDPNKTVVLIVHYEEYKKSDKLSSKYTQRQYVKK